MSPLIILTEPCKICNNYSKIVIDEDKIVPDATGLELFVDLHGMDSDPPHVRLLYIDAGGSVRSAKIVTRIINKP